MFNENLTLETFMSGLKKRNPHEPEFHQAVEEVASTLVPFVNEHRKYRDGLILERLTEPDRIITFRVSWLDDLGRVRINRGYRVQFNNAIGPYKGGLRFHPSVNLSILKFLGFEQIFKNSLTTLPLGGAKGGSNFNPRGKSDNEVMRFCQSFMIELAKYIGDQTDVPAGDIGVGAREIGYLFGQYKRIRNEFSGVLTGKGLEFGGSLIRTEATGYGCVYFAENMLNRLGDSVKGKKCLVSGSGNVAQYAAEKILDLGGEVLALSDSKGTLYDLRGLTQQKLEYIKHIKNVERASLKKVTEKYSELTYCPNKKPWDISCDLAFPCATQNEISAEDAKLLTKNGCKAVIEGANMPVSKEALEIFQKNKVLFAPGKAANAGGVATSGLEMTQNSLRLQWTREEVDKNLKEIMKKIHNKCVSYGKEDNNHINYLKGANISGFIKVADTLLSCGVT